MNQKLIIEAYKSIEYKGGEKLGSITVQINPDSYKLSKSTSYKKDESIKEDKQLPEYKHTNPSTLSFDIHFDGTGTDGEKNRDRKDQGFGEYHFSS